MWDRLTLSLIGLMLLVVASAVAAAMLIHYDYSAGDKVLIVAILAAGVVLALVAVGVNWRRRQR